MWTWDFGDIANWSWWPTYKPVILLTTTWWWWWWWWWWYIQHFHQMLYLWNSENHSTKRKISSNNAESRWFSTNLQFQHKVLNSISILRNRNISKARFNILKTILINGKDIFDILISFRYTSLHTFYISDLLLIFVVLCSW